MRFVSVDVHHTAHSVRTVQYATRPKTDFKVSNGFGIQADHIMNVTCAEDGIVHADAVDGQQNA